MTDDVADGWGAPCVPAPSDRGTISQVSGGRVEVSAYRFGPWLVHRSVPVKDQFCDPSSWAVSHEPTGHSIGLALELGFWEAVRIARALDDTGLWEDEDLSDPDGPWIFEAAIGAALHDHYVWPLNTVAQ